MGHVWGELYCLEWFERFKRIWGELEISEKEIKKTMRLWNR